MKTNEFKLLNVRQQNSFLKKLGLTKDQSSYVRLLVSSFGKELSEAVVEAKENYTPLSL